MKWFMITMLATALVGAGPQPTASLSSCAAHLGSQYKHGLDPVEVAKLMSYVSPFGSKHDGLAMSIIAAESAFNPKAVSSVGALGLMQLTTPAVEDAALTCLMPIPPRAKWSVPATNIRLGMCYMKYLSRNTSGVDELIVAYNGGYRQLANLRAGRKMATQTEQYRTRVLRIYRSHCQ